MTILRYAFAIFVCSKALSINGLQRPKIASVTPLQAGFEEKDLSGA